MAEPQVSFKIGTDNLPAIEDGSLIVKTDTKQLFVDDGSQRYEIGPYDIVKTWTEAEHVELTLTDDEIEIIQSNNHCRIVLDNAPGYKTFLYKYEVNISNEYIDFYSATNKGNVWVGAVDVLEKKLIIDKKDQNSVLVIHFTGSDSKLTADITFDKAYDAYTKDNKLLVGVKGDATYILQYANISSTVAQRYIIFKNLQTSRSDPDVKINTATVTFAPGAITFAYSSLSVPQSSELIKRTGELQFNYTGTDFGDSTTFNLTSKDIDLLDNYYTHMKLRILVMPVMKQYIFHPASFDHTYSYFTFETIVDESNSENQGYVAKIVKSELTLVVTKKEALATKASVDTLSTDVNNKLDKITTSYSKARVYAVTSGGTQTSYSVSTNPVSLDIPVVDINGQLHVSLIPTDSNSATSKKYVDDAVAGGGGSDTHITWDSDNNATFPANITATKFIGDGSGLTGISTDGELVVAHFTTVDDVRVCDKTFEELTSAKTAGKALIAYDSNVLFTLHSVSTSKIRFCHNRLHDKTTTDPGIYNISEYWLDLNSDNTTNFSGVGTDFYTTYQVDDTFALKTDFDSMVVSISYDDTTLDYTSDKTFTEIHDAIVNKKSVFLSYLPTGQYYTLESYSASNIIFTITYTSPMPTGVQVVQDQVSISSENVISPRTVRQTEIKNYDEIISKIFSGSESVGNSLALGGTDASGWQKKITYGTADPSGGEDGDIYIQLQS